MDSATDTDGNTLAAGDLEVTGIVDTTKAGVYEVTYINGSLSETAKVTVKENSVSVQQDKNSNDSKNDQFNHSDKQMKVKKVDSNLPKTGEPQNKWVILLGMSIFSVGFFYQKKIRKNG